jgi:hypothetical protein
MSWALSRWKNLNPIYLMREAAAMDDGYDSREDTLRHKEAVFKALKVLTDEIGKRGVTHDNSKLEPPEKEYFDEYTPKLKNSIYLSDEYNRFLRELEPA